MTPAMAFPGSHSKGPKPMISLSPGRIQLFYTRADTISNPRLLARYRSVLDTDELRKTDRYLDPHARHLCLTARAQVRYLVSEITGLDPGAFSFTRNDHGKPALDSQLPDLGGMKFNLSHCRGAVVCGFCLDHDIGVDMEDLGRRVDLAVADRFFSPREAAWVRAREGAGNQRFLDIWTLKEAYIKARGKGLAIPLTSFSFDLAGEGIKFYCQDRDQEKKNGVWQFFRWHPEPGKIVAAAVRSNRPFDIQTFHCVPFEGVYG